MANEPSIPSVTSAIPTEIARLLRPIREILLGYSSGLNRVTRSSDLVSLGVSSGVNQDGTLNPPDTLDFTPPPAPTGLTAGGALANILLSWDAPSSHNVSYTEVWRAQTNDFSVAQLIGRADGRIYVDPIGGAATRYYWIRYVSLANIKGPFNAQSGTAGTTGVDPAYLLTLLTGEITESQLYADLGARINLVDTPTTGLVDALAAAKARLTTAENDVTTIQGSISAINASLADLNSSPTYDNAHTYALHDIVKYSGGLYEALGTTTGNLPTNPTYWVKIGDYASIGDAVAGHAAILSDHETRITTTEGGLISEASARSTLETQIRGGYTGTDVTALSSGLIYSERQARSTAHDSEVSARELLSTSIVGTANPSGLTLSTLSAGMLFDERTARSTANDTEVGKRELLSTKVLGVADPTSATLLNISSGILFDEKTARSTANDTEVGKRELLSATLIGTNDPTGQVLNTISSGIIFEEKSARVTAMGVVTSRVDSLESTVTNPTTGVAATASALDVVKLTVNDSTHGNTALASRTNTLESAVNDGTTGLVSKSSIIYVNDTYNGERIARANAINLVTSTLDGHTATIETQQTSINGLNLQYTVKMDVDGHVSGYGLQSSLIAGGTPTSLFIVNVDQFAVATPATSVTNWTASTAIALNTIRGISGENGKVLVCKQPGTTGATAPSIAGTIGSSVIDNGVVWQIGSRVPLSVLTVPTTINGVTIAAGVYIDAAYVLNATVNTAQIGLLAVDDARIVDMTVAKLLAGNLRVGGYIRSTSYTPGASGWSIEANGNVEFNTGTFRGALSAATGTFSGNLSGAGGTFSGALSAATGTFNGSVNAGAFNVGDFNGYAWPAAGGTGLHLSVYGMLVGNYQPSAGNPGGKYFQIYTPPGGAPAIYTNIPSNIEDLQVTTLKIANNAVTFPLYFERNDTVGLSSGGTWYDYLDTGNYSCSGTGSVIITFAGFIYAAGSGGLSSVQILCSENYASWVVVKQVDVGYVSSGAIGSACCVILKRNPPAGVVRFLVQVKGNQGSGARIENGSIVSYEGKK